jgi:alpha-maltose-1-phosphate synthase
MPSVALYYHPEGYTTSGPKLMGRNAAGESFLRGFFAHSRVSEFWLQVENRAHSRHFRDRALQSGRNEPVQTITTEQLGTLRKPGALYLPQSDLIASARARSLIDNRGWSLCGITHTTASARAMDAICGMLTAPVQPWDGLICTSTAVKANVMRMIEAEADFLKSRLGASRIVLPQMPVIPLGIMTGDFAFSDADKAFARKEIGAEPDDIVVLFAGRLSFHAKAHPLAMYQALERASASLPKGARLHLVECGWYANDYIEQSFDAAAALACPSVRRIMLDGRDMAKKAIAWACADIFCSLSDNIQETFGLVPIEAMAAGLPVVGSDWDGYRDTVRNGIDGFLVPTLMAPPGAGIDLAARYALDLDNYDQYCGNACAFVSVDMDATADAFIKLITSPDLRRSMGESGRARARSLYDWKTIIPAYEAFWDELASLRKVHSVDANSVTPPWPQRMDPFEAFSAYPTQILSAETLLEWTRPDALEELERLWTLNVVNFAQKAILPKDELAILLGKAASGPRTARDLVADSPVARRTTTTRSLIFLAKCGLLRIV